MKYHYFYSFASVMRVGRLFKQDLAISGNGTAEADKPIDRMEAVQALEAHVRAKLLSDNRGAKVISLAVMNFVLLRTEGGDV